MGIRDCHYGQNNPPPISAQAGLQLTDLNLSCTVEMIERAGAITMQPTGPAIQWSGDLNNEFAVRQWAESEIGNRRTVNRSYRSI